MLIVAVFSKVTSDVIGITVLTYFSSRSQGSKPGNLTLTSVTFKTGSNQKNVWYILHPYQLHMWYKFGENRTNNKRQNAFFVGLPPGDWNPNPLKCIRAWTVGRIIAKYSLQVHLRTIYEMNPGFLIWPIFQGHRGQSWKKLQTWHFMLFDLASPNSAQMYPRARGPPS